MQTSTVRGCHCGQVVARMSRKRNGYREYASETLGRPRLQPPRPHDTTHPGLVLPRVGPATTASGAHRRAVTCSC